jgi:hypothetical protein
MSNEKTYLDKLLELDIDESTWSLFSETSVNVLYDKYKHINTINNNKSDRVMFFLNEILAEVGLDCIDNFEYFKINRDDILTVEHLYI